MKAGEPVARRRELTKARKELNMTQEQVAKAVGIDRTAYTRIEGGKRKPTVDVALKIASLLGKKVEDIFLPIDVCQKHKGDNQPASA